MARRFGLSAPTSLFAAMLVASSFAGCSCSDEEKTSQNNPGGAGGAGGAGGGGGAGAVCASDLETIEPGLLGAYASAAVGGDGSVWVAAYNDFGYGQYCLEGVDQEPTTYLFGDLVVGKVEGGRVAWSSVDGLPSGDPDPTLVDVESWRGGRTDPGNDSGLWSTIAVDGAGAIHVAHYDATDAALRYGRSTDQGATWSFHTVVEADQADAGRYAKMVLKDGVPVIAFLVIEPGGATPGRSRSVIRVARAASATPGAAGDWAFSDAAINDDTPCRRANCAAGEECRSDVGVCQAPATGCTEACATGTECFDDAGTLACGPVIIRNFVESYPEAAGLYISLAVTSGGLGIAYYDRLHGNLLVTQETGGTWSAPMIVDGQDDSDPAAPVDTGDVGIGTSLFVDAAGDWHLAYADGFAESVKYARLTGGTAVALIDTVDNGSRGTAQGVMGDDTHIDVDSAGTVRIAYQDATFGKARYATGGPGAWQVRDLDVPGFAGGFSHIVTVGGATQVLTWTREAKPLTVGDVAIVTP